MASAAGMQDDATVVVQSGPEAIAAAYLAVCDGDPRHALVRAIGDALADLCEAERRCRQQGRLVSHGYVRGGLSAEVRS